MSSRLRKVLLDVLHISPSLPDPGAIAALTADDWHRLTDDAIRFRLAFQLSEFVNADPRTRALIPTTCVDRLNEAVRATLMRNMKQILDLRGMLDACDAASIPVILLKGLWLTQGVYRDLRARSSGDIDLLLRPDDVRRFTKVARALGFELPGGAADLHDLVSATNEVQLIHPKQMSRFDIHWSLTRPHREAPIDEDVLWQRSTVVSIAGASCRSLKLEDHLVYLCFHATLHHHFRYVGPGALLDVATLILDPSAPIDWEDLTDRTRSLGWGRGVWLMFDLVREHLGVQPPQAVLDQLRPDADDASEIRDAATDAMFLDRRSEDSLPWRLATILNEPSPRKRVEAVWHRLIPSRQEIAATRFRARSDSRNIPWLYMRRWVSLLGHHLPKLVSLLAGDRKRAAELERTRVIRRWMSS